MNWLLAFVDLFLESAPWLILGLVMAGVLKELVSMQWMERQLGKNARFGVVYSLLGKRALISYLTGVLVCALGFGFLCDWIFASFELTLNVADSIHAHTHVHWWSVLSGVLLASLIGLSLAKLLANKWSSTSSKSCCS